MLVVFIGGLVGAVALGVHALSIYADNPGKSAVFSVFACFLVAVIGYALWRKMSKDS
jgi:hypothetical protein